MKPATYTLTTVVPAPVERVFQALTDPHTMAQWLPSARAVEAVAPLKKGSRLRVVYDTREAEIEVVDFNQPSVFGWSERSGRRMWRTFFRLEFAGASTRLTVQTVWQAPSLIAWIKVKLRQSRNVMGQMDAMVQNLRMALEK
ncbi:MAG TPA: SRPBCC family protein [Gemmatimonadales bacterium]|nr:SRPBCC family protein [Gemmatimonadales bacterium]HKE90087.1 SRPBCC family protein [Gemmatimonadales bacterium]